MGGGLRGAGESIASGVAGTCGHRQGVSPPFPLPSSSTPPSLTPRRAGPTSWRRGLRRSGTAGWRVCRRRPGPGPAWRASSRRCSATPSAAPKACDPDPARPKQRGRRVAQEQGRQDDGGVGGGVRGPCAAPFLARELAGCEASRGLRRLRRQPGRRRFSLRPEPALGCVRWPWWHTLIPPRARSAAASTPSAASVSRRCALSTSGGITVKTFPSREEAGVLFIDATSSSCKERFRAYCRIRPLPP